MSKIRIEVSAWDAGCLPALLTREIGAVERQVRVAGDRHTAEEAAMTDAYLGQLRGVLGAVEKARRPNASAG